MRRLIASDSAGCRRIGGLPRMVPAPGCPLWADWRLLYGKRRPVAIGRFRCRRRDAGIKRHIALPAHGQREPAREHLTTATTMYREMGMTYWLEQAEAEMRDVAR